MNNFKSKDLLVSIQPAFPHHDSASPVLPASMQAFPKCTQPSKSIAFDYPKCTQPSKSVPYAVATKDDGPTKPSALHAGALATVRCPCPSKSTTPEAIMEHPVHPLTPTAILGSSQGETTELAELKKVLAAMQAEAGLAR